MRAGLQDMKWPKLHDLCAKVSAPLGDFIRVLGGPFIWRGKCIQNEQNIRCDELLNRKPLASFFMGYTRMSQN